MVLYKCGRSKDQNTGDLDTGSTQFRRQGVTIWRKINRILVRRIVRHASERIWTGST
jgi:hypothetical protein